MSDAAVYTSLSLPEVCQRLEGMENPLLLLHVRPDGDAVGSAEALAILFRLLGHPAAIFSPDPIPERLAFISANSEALPFSEKTSYTAVSVDVASPSQLGSGSAFSPVLMIDHHASGTAFADYYTVPEASATGEILYAIARYLYQNKKIPVFPKALADALYTAISSDTGCFRYANVTEKTHLVAAELLAYGAAAAEINHALFETKSASQLRAEAFAASRLRVYGGGKIAAVFLEKKDREKEGLSSELFETAIDIPRSLRGVEIAVTLKESDETAGLFKVSLRSTGRNVAEVAAAFGGGGHIRAAGCSISGKDATEVMEKLLPLLT